MRRTFQEQHTATRKDIIEFCRDVIRIGGITTSMLLVVRTAHRESYSDLKGRWCKLANELTDEECMGMWQDPPNATVPERLFDEELDERFNVDQLIRDRLARCRVDCSEQSMECINDLMNVLKGMTNE